MINVTEEIKKGREIQTILNQNIEDNNNTPNSKKIKKKINFKEEKLSNGNKEENVNFKRREKRIRSLCIDKNSLNLKSGEAILNEIYQHKKTMCQHIISKKGTKSSMNVSMKNNENGLLNINEKEEEEKIKNLSQKEEYYMKKEMKEIFFIF